MGVVTRSSAGRTYLALECINQWEQWEQWEQWNSEAWLFQKIFNNGWWAVLLISVRVCLHKCGWKYPHITQVVPPSSSPSLPSPPPPPPPPPPNKKPPSTNRPRGPIWKNELDSDDPLDPKFGSLWPFPLGGVHTPTHPPTHTH